mmetsp:Transcript_35694/g.90043  ORF Transcript_35694/g.90043 Transcript_35694/m.90043 type:complete len:395 (-) Transcript_35694:106-1290(-)
MYLLLSLFSGIRATLPTYDEFISYFAPSQYIDGASYDRRRYGFVSLLRTFYHHLAPFIVLFAIGFMIMGGTYYCLLRSEQGLAFMAGTLECPNTFLIDSGCNHSYVSRGAKGYFRNLNKLDKPVRISGIAGAIECTEMGTLEFQCLDANGMLQTVTMKDVLYSPEGHTNLLLVSHFNKLNFSVRFNTTRHGGPQLVNHSANDSVIPLRNLDGLFTFARDALVWKPRLVGRLEVFEPLTSSTTAEYGSDAPPQAMFSNADQLHLRYHTTARKLREMCNQVPEMKNWKPTNFRFHQCRFCAKANARKAPARPMSRTTYASDEDGWSCYQYDLGEHCLTHDGNRYVYVFVLFHSRFIHVELTPNRSFGEVSNAILHATQAIGEWHFPTAKHMRVRQF